VSFAAITLCVAFQRVFIVVIVVYFVMDSVRKLLNTPSYSLLIEFERILSLLLTPWKRVLFEELIFTPLVKLPAFHETRNFITVFTRARHGSLS
jgi:hypothetical protein